MVVLVPLICVFLGAATGALSVNLQRAAIFQSAGALFLAAAAWEIHARDATEPLRSRKLLAATLALFCLSFVAGLALILAGSARADRIALIFFVQILCYFATALFVSGFLTERIAINLRNLAEQDPLTGVSNRARLEHLLHLPPAPDTAAIMVDIDHFKSVNDRYGHLAGDVVLTEIAKLLMADLRESDLCVRYGGEEFLIAVPEADALQLAERLRARIASHAIDIGRPRKVSVTASFGIGVQRAPALSWADLIEVADRALYEAKATGRNRVALREATSSGAAAVAST